MLLLTEIGGMKDTGLNPFIMMFEFNYGGKCFPPLVVQAHIMLKKNGMEGHVKCFVIFNDVIYNGGHEGHQGCFMVGMVVSAQI